MYLFLPLVAGCLIGFIKRGSIWNLSLLKLKWIWVVPIAYVIQYASIYFLQGPDYEVFILMSYLTLILFCFRNRLVPGVKITLIGIFLNLLVLAVNHLRMPAYLPAARILDPNSVEHLKEGLIGKSIAMTNDTHLNFLGDIFTIHIGRGSLVSIGDILIGIGIMVLIQYAMCIERTTKLHGDTK
jgi:hypothetical protein